MQRRRQDDTLWVLFRHDETWQDCTLTARHAFPEIRHLAACLHTQAEDILTSHTIRGQVYLLPEWLNPLIVQMQHTVLLASEVLVLVDVVIHRNRQHPLDDVEPKIVRRVQILPHILTRSELLRELKLREICFERGTCIAQADDLHWGEEEVSQRNLFHGSYILIHVAPLRVSDMVRCFTTGLSTRALANAPRFISMIKDSSWGDRNCRH